MDLSLQSGRRWVGHLSTDGLAPGCYRVVAMVGGLGVGGFGLEVRGDSVTLEGTQAKGRVAKP
jgi:hypothetical protein